MKIAFLCPFHLDRLTGTPVRARTTVEAMRAAGEVYVLATGGALPEVRPIPETWEERTGRPARLRLDRFTRRALEHLRAIRPNILHVVTTAGLPPALLYKLRFPSTRLILEIHGITGYEQPDGSWTSRFFYEALERMGVQRADAIVAMSRTQQEILRGCFNVPRQKIHVLWGPVDIALYRSVPPPVFPPFCVGYLGNANLWQGLKTAWEAAQLLDNEKGIHFLFGGFDPAPDCSLRTNITFAGPLAPQAGSEFLSRAHVLLSPRIGGRVSDAQYPHKLSHYLAAGRPIIASATSDQAAILKEADCGLSFPPGDAQALADAILQVRDLPEPRRVQMGVQARRFAEAHLSTQRLAQKLMPIYTGRG